MRNSDERTAMVALAVVSQVLHWLDDRQSD